MLKQSDTIEYTASAYSDSETVGNVDGTTVFVPEMIVGEKAKVRLNYVNAKKNVAYGDVCRVLSASPLRTIPPCPHFGSCGGCALQHMDYAEQLRFKQCKVRNNLKKIGGLDCEVSPTVPSPKIFGYRNKLSLPVRGKTDNVQIGMYRKGSHNLVDMQNCLLGGEWSGKLVALFREFLNEQHVAPYDEQTFEGAVRHLVARYVDGQLLVTVVTNGRQPIDFRPFAQSLSKNFSRYGLFVNENSFRNNVIMGKTTRRICGLKQIESENLGVKFFLRPDSFFQVNDFVKDLIYLKTRQLLDVSQTQILVDCFSGVSILTTVLASESYKTTAIEIVPQAVEDAKQNALLNNSPNVTNICGDVNVELPLLVKKHEGKVISLVVDPPRKGLCEKICNTILSTRIDNIVYISCDSATLARDLKMLCRAYAVDCVCPFDMFPQTSEVETVVHLKRIFEQAALT